MNNSTAKTCKNCQWWDPINSVIGECRRMPPHPADNVADPRWWPGTKRDNLYPNKVGGVIYYRYKRPDTGTFHSLGTVKGVADTRSLTGNEAAALA